MEDYQAAEETAFVVDEVSNIVKEAIESTIGGNAYQHSKVNQWFNLKKKKKTELAYDPAITPLGIYLKKTKTLI